MFFKYKQNKQTKKTWEEKKIIKTKLTFSQPTTPEIEPYPLWVNRLRVNSPLWFMVEQRFETSHSFQDL